MAEPTPKPGRVLGMIPAKGGSQRLARKNVLPLGGKPLLQWAIEAARGSGVIDKLIVSTEDEAIAALARDLGAEVPFLRPAEMARDPFGVVDVALHALRAMREAGEEYATLVVLLPTCPLRTAGDLSAAMDLFRGKGASFLMSVSQCDHTPFTALRLGDGLLHPYFPDYMGRKPGQLPPAYRCNGAIHVLDVKAFEREKSYYAQPLVGYVMPPERSVDIDTALSLKLAELILAGT
jgi:N-acylneuraminate cytidylyltransferase